MNFVVGYRLNGLATSKDSLTLSGGLFLPTGKTEPNPYQLGDFGKKHLHLQFGTGTLTPTFQYRYWLPIGKSVAIQSRLITRRPFYRNNYHFLAPPVVQSLKGRDAASRTLPWCQLNIKGASWLFVYLEPLVTSITWDTIVMMMPFLTHPIAWLD